MPEEPNSLAAAEGAVQRDYNGVPDEIRRRYFVDGRGGGGLGYYVDAQIKTAAFRDEVRRLTSTRTDPNAIRDMVSIASHRGWTEVTLSGSQSFKREVWMESRVKGLQVHGYRPTQRDLQALERRLHNQRQPPPTTVKGTRSPNRKAPREAGAEATLKFVEAVVRARVVDPQQRASIIERATDRVDTWLERGGRFAPPSRVLGEEHRDRSRSR